MKVSRVAATAIVGVVAMVAIPQPAVAGSRGVTSLVSVSSHGSRGNEWSARPAISADGRFVAFYSDASNLVPGDTNGQRDVFVRDRLAGITQRVSTSTTGRQGNYPSSLPEISANGRFVVFNSFASNLVPGDTNGYPDVFVHDRLARVTERVSLSAAGRQANEGSASDLTPAISADGRFIAFTSHASNLVPGDTNGGLDVFVRDRTAGITQRVSIAITGHQGGGGFDGPTISADGRFVAFVSPATDLVSGDTNGVDDVFVRDRLADTTHRVSISTSGRQGNSDSFDAPAVSADGRFVTFSSHASNLVPGDTNSTSDVFIRDRLAETTQRISITTTGQQSNDWSFVPDISGDGRFVSFLSSASNLVPGDTNNEGDVFVRDRVGATTQRVSISTTGRQANGYNGDQALSADGEHIAFQSLASNLVPGDTNGISHVFVRDPVLGSAG